MSQTRWLPVLVFLALLAALMCPVLLSAQAQTVMPDGIAFVDGTPVLQAGGINYEIDLQLTIQGANYSGNNFGIFFISSNPGIINIPWGTSVVSDSHGRATLNVTTGPGYGNVTVTAALLSPDGAIRASKTYVAMGFGNISGVVTDATGQGIPAATVTLYAVNNSARGEMLSITGNPATTAGRDAAVPGAYAFSNVPFGTYVIEAAIGGQATNVTHTVSRPTESVDMSITGYVVPTPTPMPTPTPTPSPGPTSTVTPVPASPTPAPKTPTGDESRQIIWILAVALVLAVIIIGIQVLRKRKR